jgi:hypothetical protein
VAPRVFSQPPPDEVYEFTEHEGWHVEWVEDTKWEVVSESRKCRRPGCQRPSVARFMRSNGWWHYCDWHLYGRRVVDGRVLGRRLVPDEPESS